MGGWGVGCLWWLNVSSFHGEPEKPSADEEQQGSVGVMAQTAVPMDDQCCDSTDCILKHANLHT